MAIARALLAEPRILILDDATSSVDATTESRIKDALREVMEGRTTFVIAHRLSTIALADEIVVLEGGEIAARGTHDELLEARDALPRDRREGTAGPGVPHAQADPSGRWRGCEAPDGRSSAASAAAPKLRQLISLLRPYRGRVMLMFVALVIATAAALAPPTSPAARSTTASGSRTCTRSP